MRCETFYLLPQCYLAVHGLCCWHGSCARQYCTVQVWRTPLLWGFMGRNEVSSMHLARQKRPGEALPPTWLELHPQRRLRQCPAFLFFQNIQNRSAWGVITGTFWPVVKLMFTMSLSIKWCVSLERNHMNFSSSFLSAYIGEGNHYKTPPSHAKQPGTQWGGQEHSWFQVRTLWHRKDPDPAPLASLPPQMTSQALCEGCLLRALVRLSPSAWEFSHPSRIFPSIQKCRVWRTCSTST